ncbi:serine hydroxymethyltransferase, partial [Aneurinibacillus migulanus]|nr:serine hydroxymethyltransferase [Aneurinibacillus migulanus]
DNHIILIDLRNIGLTGKEAQQLLDDIGVTVNKNAIPFDTNSPLVTSGIRLGTPAVTTRGMEVEEMKEIARIIALTLKNPQQSAVQEQMKGKVKEITSRFPLYDARTND